ncbi:MAG: hypothetical protein WKF79_15720, partial [Nocardioides sp.]
MRAFGTALPTLFSVILIAGVGTAQVASAEDDPVPSHTEVRQAENAATGAVTDVAGVESALSAANRRLEESVIAAAQAAEAFNGARWRLEEARVAAHQTEQAVVRADRAVERQRDIYADTVVTAYQTMPGLSALSTVLESDHIGTVLEHTATVRNAEDVLDGRYDDFQVVSEVAIDASERAEAARSDAERAEADALVARDQAQSAADTATAEAQAVADEKAGLISELARLEGTSIELAEQRQAGLEQQARADAAAAAAQQAAADEAEAEAEADAGAGQEPTPQPEPSPDPV